MKNPLRPALYLARNLNKTGPMMGVIILAVMLICSIVSLVNSIPYSIKVIYSYSKQYLAVSPRGMAEKTIELQQMIEQESPVPLGKTMLVRASEVEVRSIVGRWPFVIIALQPGDMDYYIKRVGNGELNGRLPEAGKPEVVVSEPFARNLKLKLGSVLLKPDDQDYYSPQEVKVVGIIDTTEWFAIAPYQYFADYHYPPIDGLIVFAEDNANQSELDAWVKNRLTGENARTYSYAELEESADSMFSILYQILNFIIGTLVLVITLMMGLLMNIYLSQRVQEFGLLQALGYTKKSLLKRVLVETIVLVVGGWIIGMLLAFALIALVKVNLMDPQAFALALFDKKAYLSTIPVPIAITIMALMTIIAKFKKFDPVAVVERRLI